MARSCHISSTVLTRDFLREAFGPAALSKAVENSLPSNSLIPSNSLGSIETVIWRAASPFSKANEVSLGPDEDACANEVSIDSTSLGSMEAVVLVTGLWPCFFGTLDISPEEDGLTAMGLAATFAGLFTFFL